MSKMIKTTLIALTILAGATAGYAADGKGNGNGNGNGVGSGKGFGTDGGRSDEQMEMLDRKPTGSIVGCDSGTYDAKGNCVYVDRNMQ